MIVLAIANACGGTGKTTTAVTLAAIMAEQRRTLLVDLDPRGHAASFLGIEPAVPGAALADVLAGEAEPADAVRRTVLPRLDVMPAGALLNVAFEARGEADDDAVSCLAALLAALPGYDRVVLDLPSADNLASMAAMVAATHVLVPVPATFFGVEGLTPQIQGLARIVAEFNPRLRFEGALPTMFSEGSKVAGMVIRVLVQNFGPELVLPPIDHDVDAADAPCYGEPITRYAPGGPVAVAYRGIARLIEAHWRRATPAAPPPVTGAQAA